MLNLALGKKKIIILLKFIANALDRVQVICGGATLVYLDDTNTFE